MSKKDLTPIVATHPGEMIKDELKERGMTQKQLAEQTGIKASVLSETVNGKRPISINVAVALEKALDIPADIWMNMQTQYDLDSANITKRDNQRQTFKIVIYCKNLFVNLAGLAYFNLSCYVGKRGRLIRGGHYILVKIMLFPFPQYLFGHFSRNSQNLLSNIPKKSQNSGFTRYQLSSHRAWRNELCEHVERSTPKGAPIILYTSQRACPLVRCPLVRRFTQCCVPRSDHQWSLHEEPTYP